MSFKTSIKELAKSNVHFGHKKSKRHPNMQEFIWGKKNGAYLIDLAKTAFMLEESCKYLERLLSNGGQAMWIGTKEQAKKSVQSIAESLKHPGVVHRWIGGTFTNYEQVQKAVTRYLHMKDVVAKPLPHHKKKEIAMMKKEVERLEKNVGGLVNMNALPAVLIAVDVKREATSIKEANFCKIPVVGIVDTNSSTKGIDVVIPANDDSDKSIEFILNRLKEAVEMGSKAYKVKKDAQDKEDLEKNKKRTEKIETKPGAKEFKGKPKKTFSKAPIKKTDSSTNSNKESEPTKKTTTTTSKPAIKKAPMKKAAATKPADKKKS